MYTVDEDGLMVTGPSSRVKRTIEYHYYCQK